MKSKSGILCFLGMTMERAKMEINPPYDKYNLIFMTLLLHGVGTLMPWNMFITAKSVRITETKPLQSPLNIQFLFSTLTISWEKVTRASRPITIPIF